MNVKSYFNELTEPLVVRRGLIVSILVGSILTFINNFGILVTGDYSKINLLTVLLTFLVPFLVSTYSTILSRVTFIPGEVSPIDVELKCKECADVTVQLKKGDVIPECKHCPGKKIWVVVAKGDSIGSSQANFFRHNPSPVIRVDSDGKILDANEAFTELEGNEAIGQEISKYFDTLDNELIHEIIEYGTVANHKQVLKGKQYQFEMRGIKEAGVAQIYGSDISELENIKDKLQSLSHFPKLNPAPVLRISREGIIIDGNPAAKELLSEDLVGKHAGEFLEDVQALDFGKVIDDNKIIQFKYHGENKVYNCSLRGIKDLDVCQVYGADITDIEKSKKEIKSFALFAQLNPEPVFRFNGEGEILEANPASLEAFRKNELKGLNLNNLLQISHINLQEIVEGNKIEIIDTKLYDEVFRFIIRGISDLGVCQCYGSNVTEKVSILQLQEKRIQDSIQSAKKIQQAAIPSDEFIQRLLPGSFVFFQPRDVVSGDFYWITKKEQKIYFAAVDCTGHGVPGGFMSMLGISLLNEIARSDVYQKASDILNEMRDRVKNTLFQSDDSMSKEGMDMALCIYDCDTKELQYSGAFNPLVICKEGESNFIAADRMPVGVYYNEKESFTNHSMQVNPDDVIYIFSDGFADQFGGENNKKYMKKRLFDLFSQIHTMPAEEQKQMLAEEFKKWKGSNEQIDDVLVMGVKFSEILKAS